MKRHFIFLLLIASLSACVSEKTRHEGVILIQNPAPVTSISYNDSRYFSQCKAIRLEFSSEESLIGKISQLEVRDGFIYILDEKTQTLKIFDTSGKYIRAIGKRGNGPGEYIAINAFYLNKDKRTINLFDPMKISVHQYDLNGNFLESVKCKDLFLAHIARATLLDNGELFCFTNPNWQPESGYFILNEADYSLKHQLYKHPVPIENQISYTILDHPYICKGNEIQYVSLFSNAIQSYENGETRALYYVENDRQEMDSSYLESLISAHQDNYIKIISVVADNGKYTTGLKNIFETDRYICVDFYVKRFFSQAVLWDKKENKGYHISEYESYTPDFGKIAYCFDNTLVRIWRSDQIQLLKTNLETGAISATYPQDILDIVNQYEEDDNPVLLLYTMKE